MTGSSQPLVFQPKSIITGCCKSDETLNQPTTIRESLSLSTPMDGGNGERQSDENESLAINVNDGAYRVPSNGGLGTYTQHGPLTNGAGQMQTTTQVLNQEGRQDPSKNQRQDGVASAAVTLSIGEVSGSIGGGISSSTTVEDNGSQVVAETTTASGGGTVVIPQEYLAVAATATPHYVTTEQTHSDTGGSLSVEEMDHDDKDRDDNEILREQDRFLPIANVARIMKKSIPKTGKIAKDAKECVQECVSEFISFITSEASERCHQEKRKTINGEDILFAMTTLGFDQYVEPLKLYLQKYRESMKGEKVTMGSVSGEPGDMDDEGQSISHYSTAPIHPTMIPQEQASAIYGTTYAGMQQSLQFQPM